MTRLIRPGRPPRGRLAGVAQIIGFNRGMYAASGAALAGGVALVWLVPLPEWARVVVWVALALGAYLTAASLAVSYWVYDRSDVTRWAWLVDPPQRWPDRWVNVHCGFDQTTALLRELTGETGGLSLDVYDPARMTEPSIARARSASTPCPGTAAGRFDRWPIRDRSVDGVFMLLAAHELREPARRVALLREARRVLGPGGRLWLAEHTRDPANFLAFGPGFTHFFSRASWRRDLEASGLELIEERARTPFIRLFLAMEEGG